MSKRRLQKRTRSLAWDDLRCVLAIARTGSLSGAARALGVGHSTVFRRLNAIERRLGVTLFDRTREGYCVTASGELAVAAASAMEIEALAVERRMLDSAGSISGVVRLATSELFAGFLLPAVLRDFLAQHPQIEVEIDVSSRAVDLTRREADLAIRASNTPPDELIGRQLGELRYAVYGARGTPRVSSIASLNEHQWLGLDQSLAHLAIARWRDTRVPHASTRVRFNSLAPLLHAVGEGLGVAILPIFAADRLDALSRLTSVLDEPRMKLWVLSHGDTRDNARVRALAQHLGRHLPRVLTARQKDGQ
ncbi:MAG TPA: LysR family transcriptional regulator [Steroidobacteraceae bacterium]|nr:LysR family transcriptional regulator [Steroidobacteraceae bacterium]